ncbi:ribosomal subunit interface protein [Leptolyngbya sp. Heron Island J]|uniref:ribosome hibernation-promoting factor, HPF/YfiA family n=1 Tax=Leptolyngbya sp. Heron Island J TaxID=1385935 RepID=UPI0003B9F988|nr:ribosome-associated translation inhibitor RaiA [Leptolyngbya sp. Heron Island J]ESA33596.1 ribosomal subunit interface protein [Leptolyngbya sp. Heron Island J]
MKVVIQGKNVEITEAIYDYTCQKIGKAVNHFENLVTEIDVKLSVHRCTRNQDRQTAEVTTYAKGVVIRAVEKHEDLYSSIDLVSDKITRQLKKYKEKQQRVNVEPDTTGQETLDAAINPTAIINEHHPVLPPKVVRNKFFAMSSMSVEAALEQLQLIDHDFYMFQNESTGEINVIYERGHGGYGLIQPHQRAMPVGQRLKYIPAIPAKA